MEENKQKSVPVPDQSASDLSNLSKRQQVAKANKMIFIWVAAASIVLVACLIVSSFLVRQLFFNNKIIKAKSETNKTVMQNIESGKALKEEVDKLLADENLASVKANAADNNLKVIFDALPTTGDSTTLTNSLYTHVFTTAGVTTEGITVGDQVLVQSLALSAAPGAAAQGAVPGGADGAPQPQAVPIQAVITGDKKTTLQAFKNLERVIRPTTITQFTLEVGTDNRLKTSLIGESYYLKSDAAKIGTKEVKP